MAPDPGAATHPLDRHHDRDDGARVRRLAGEVAAAYGGDLTRMRRAHGFSNATWVGDGIAVRIAHTRADMDREVALVRALPPGVGHPRVLGAGTIQGHGWIVSAVVPGQNLYEAWPLLDPAEQGRAVHELWARAVVAHDASRSLGSLVSSSGGFVPASVAEAMTTVGDGRGTGLSAALLRRLRDVVEGFFRAAPAVEQVVNHGDLALANALWDGEVVALLDFEFAVLGPVEIDLCRLLHETRVSPHGRYVDSRAGTAALEIAAARMDSTHGRELLRGAAVLDQLRDLGIWLAQEDSTGRVEDSRPGRLLMALLDAPGGYLEPLLE